MALSSRSLITKTGINTTQVFDMGGINIAGGDFNLGSTIKLGNASGIITCTTFSGSGASLTNLPAGNLTGTVADARISSLTASKLSGALPAIDGSNLTGITQTTINTNSDNRVLTGTNTANTIQGESGLLFDGQNLQIKNAAPLLQLIDTGVSNVEGRVGGDGGNLVIAADHNNAVANSLITFTIDQSEKLRIDSSGRVGITSIIPASKFTVKGGSIFVGDNNMHGGSAGVIEYGGNSGHFDLKSYGMGGQTTIRMFTSQNGNNAERLRIDNIGGVHIATTSGNEKLNVNGAIRASGSSANFNAGLEGAIVDYDTSNNIARFGHVNGASGSGRSVAFLSGGIERLRIASDGSCYFGPQIITEADMNWGHDAHQRPFVFSGNQAGTNPADATIVVANPNTNPSSTRLGSFMFGCKTSTGGNSGIKAYIEGWTTSNPSNAHEAGGYVKFVTRQSGGSLTENFKIDHDGKLYKSGNHFYPLVNYVEVSSFTAASVSSNSWTDLRTIYSNYSPKKANNLIVIHHQSQCWQGGQANSNGDAMWKIQRQEGGGSWTDVIANERIMGNMDGRNYTGDSGLARHHRTVHLMGSFTSNGSSFNLKTQGKVDFTTVGLQFYHHSQNILQIWEYEKG